MTHEKVRPTTLDDVIGQPRAVTAIRKLAARAVAESIPVLLTGPSGSGKTTITRALLNDLDADNIYDSSTLESRTATLHTIQRAEAAMYHHPVKSNIRVTVIEEVHAITGPTRDFLLGLLERMPRANLLIATTTQPTPFDPTLMSRWIKIRLQPLTPRHLNLIVARATQITGAPALAAPAIQIPILKAKGNARALLTKIFDEPLDQPDFLD